MSQPDFSSWSSMPSRLTTAWNDLEAAKNTAHDRDRAEMEAVMAKLEEEYNDAFTTSTDEENAVWDRFDELKGQMDDAWTALKACWDSKFSADVPNAKTVYEAARTWKEDVLAGLGDHENVIAQSPARMKWTGPGAEAYAEKLPDQVQAMADLKGHVQTAAYGAEQGALLLGGVYTAVLSEVEGLAEAIDGLPGDDSGSTFANRIYNVRFYLEDYLETLEKYHSGDGVWDAPASDAQTAMSDSVPQADVLSTPNWPVASAESMQDMQPGTPTAPPAPITPPVPEPPPVTPTGPDTTDTTPPAAEDRSNQERTDTSDVGDEGND